MEKKKYINPEFDVVEFEEEDVITASGDGFKDDGFASEVPVFTGL